MLTFILYCSTILNFKFNNPNRTLRALNNINVLAKCNSIFKSLMQSAIKTDTLDI